MKHKITSLLAGIALAVPAVAQDGGQLLPDLMAGSPAHTVFNRLLVATGWADSLRADRDPEYERLYAEGKIPAEIKAWAGMIGFPTPTERRYGFTVVAETDSVYEALTGAKAADITPQMVCDLARRQGTDGDEEDFTHPDNALNRFVSYHLLPVALNPGMLVIYLNHKDYNRETHNIPVATATEYRETLGAGRRLMKMSRSRQSGGVCINRRAQLDPETYGELSCAIPGIRVGDGAQQALNGYVYPIRDLLVYTPHTAAEVLGGERLRFDLAGLFPELTNNHFRLSKDCGLPPNSIYPYLSNLEILTDSPVVYQNGKHGNWPNYQGDEVNAPGVHDLIIRLPAVPASGVYELRIAQQTLGSRGVYQFYFGADKENLEPCGLPVDMGRESEQWSCWAEDTDYPMVNRQNDLQMREAGLMKGPESVQVAGSKTFRQNEFTTRRILGRFPLEAGQTYYLRVASCLEDSRKELFLDYLEWVPAAVYDNAEVPEDIW